MIAIKMNYNILQVERWEWENYPIFSSGIFAFWIEGNIFGGPKKHPTPAGAAPSFAKVGAAISQRNECNSILVYMIFEGKSLCNKMAFRSN